MSILRITSIILLFFYLQTAYSAEEFFYRNPFESSKFFSITENPVSVALYDVAYQANLCAEADKYICIESQILNFAVPRHWPVSQMTWKVGKFEFSMGSTKEIYILGQVINVFPITSKQGEGTYEFLYSRSRGIVGFKVSTDDGIGIFLSVKRNGFGTL